MDSGKSKSIKQCTHAAVYFIPFSKCTHATCLLLHSALRWLVVTLSMIGKLSSSAAYGTIYLFSTELHPTVVRSAALALSALSASLGAMIAPYIVETVILKENFSLI